MNPADENQGRGPNPDRGPLDVAALCILAAAGIAVAVGIGDLIALAYYWVAR